MAYDWIEGGGDPIGGACGPLAVHSFFGVEKKTIDRMATGIRDQEAPELTHPVA